MDSGRTATGVGVSPGLGHGELHVDVDDALDAIDAGRPVVLALETSSPADVPAMTGAAAIVVVRGDASSHAAVVARASGVPAVGGVEAMRIGENGIDIAGVAINVGSEVTVDGDNGTVRWGVV